MSVNFFVSACQQITDEKKFGLCDFENSSPAKIDIADDSNWNAIVLNDSGKKILFTAIDNCIEVRKENGEMDSRCDCMLTTDSTLFLIELKNKRSNWQAEGLSQIENIAVRMINEIPEFYQSFSRRMAVVANKKFVKPEFHNTNLAQREKFKSQFKMRIQFEKEIIIK